MANKTRIKDSYELLCLKYAPYTGEIIKDLWESNSIFDFPKGIFPPLDLSSFSSRAVEEGFYEYNCAVLTAYRVEDKFGRVLTKEEKDERNNKLLACLNRRKKEGLLDFIYYVQGCFKEEGRPAEEPEECFFIYGNNNRLEIDFFSAIYRLSEKFEQDSFLYKCAGRTRRAFFITTNKAARDKHGLVYDAGNLYLNLPEKGPYTNIKNGDLTIGRFTFSVHPPNDEEIAYSLQFDKESKTNVY